MLVSASTTSFVAERLAQNLCLVCRNQSIKIPGIGGMSNQPFSRGAINFSITHPDSKGKTVPVEALILSKITSNLLPLQSVTMDTKWKHLDGLKLADPGFGTPGNVEVLLRADIFNFVMLDSRRFGPSGSPSALKMQFGWALVGAVSIGHASQSSTNQYCISTLLDSQGANPWQESTNQINVKSFVLGGSMLGLNVVF